MAYEYLTIGTQRIDRQAYIGPTDSNFCIKLYHVTACGSTSNATVVISISQGTTATNITTPYLHLPLLDSGTLYSVDWDSHYGRIIGTPNDTGTALFHTFTGFSYALVEYTVLRR